ncbi:MAG: phage tail tape measure protein [Deltaproteobacteria bacterium]|nr:phage tail tape measure protein [Deltaproteobacteria bacterium]
MSVSSIAIEFSIIDSLSKGVSVIKDRLHSLSSASKEVKQDFDRMASSFKYAAMAGLATRELYKGMKPAVGLAGDLQQEMLGVQAELMGSGKDARQLAEELKAVKSTAFEVQAWTPFDMTQIATLEKELVKAGARVEDITGKTGAAAASAALAVYERLDPVATGNALVSIGTPFKITAAGYMELADTISRAASASTVGAAEIADSARYAAGPMASLGKSSKEMLALSAVMAQVGISGSMAGVALKEFFLEAAKNKAFKDTKGNLIPTVEIVEKLKRSFKGVGEAERASRLNKIFGERGMQAAVALLNDGKGSYEDIVRSMEQSASLQDKINLSMQGFNNQMLSLKGTFKSTIADLFLPALPALTLIVAKTNELAAALGLASQKNTAVGKAVTYGTGATMGLLGGGALALGLAGVLHARKVLLRSS